MTIQAKFQCPDCIQYSHFSLVWQGRNTFQNALQLFIVWLVLDRHEHHQINKEKMNSP